jgi:uncharacterized protein involved in exopolysaccharide biosynthesis
MLNGVKIKAEMRLKDITMELRDKQVRLNLDGGGIGRVGIKEMELSKLVAEQVDAQLRAGKAKAEYDALENATKQGNTPPAVLAQAENDPEVRRLQQTLGETELRIETASTKVNENNPTVAELRATADALRKRIAARQDALVTRARSVALDEAKMHVDASAMALEILSKRVDNLKQDLAELSNATVAYYNLQAEEKGLREQLRVIKQQIETVMAEQTTRESIDIHWHLAPDVVP